MTTTNKQAIGFAQRINSFLLCQTDKIDAGVKKYIEACTSGIIEELKKPKDVESITDALEDVSRKLTLLLPAVEDKEDRQTLETVITEDLPALRKLII